MTKGYSHKKIDKMGRRDAAWSSKKKRRKFKSSGRLRKKQATFSEIRKKFYSHDYWRLLALRAAVLSWVNYKADTLIGTELRLELQTRAYNSAPANRSKTIRPIWAAGRKLSDTEVYRIAEDICGYSPGDALFPEHLTREEAMFFIEVTEMIQEAWESMKYSFLKAAENREIKLNAHFSTNQKDGIERHHATASDTCFRHVGALNGKKGELIHNWLSICDERKGCYNCYKAAEMSMLNDTERLELLTRSRDEAVTSFRTIKILTSRLKQFLEQAAKGSEGHNLPKITFDDGHVFETAAFNKKYADIKWNKYTDVVTSTGAMYRLVNNSVCTHYNKEYGHLPGTGTLRCLGYSMVRWGKLQMRTDTREHYEPLYDLFNHMLVGLDPEIYPKLILPDDCGCSDCKGVDFLTDPDLM